jgi:crossover junction endodeoxyribonuclease RuvC
VGVRRLRVLGVDPGMAVTGYGCVEGAAGQAHAVSHGTLRATGDAPEQLAQLFAAAEQLLSDCRPDALAVERLFYGRNVRTAMGVGQARGVLLLAAARAGLPVHEYTPTAVKTAVTGYGAAGKGQVQAMVRALLRLTETPRPDDAADALAVALCCLQSLPLALRAAGARA